MWERILSVGLAAIAILVIALTLAEIMRATV
jgi:hypothetical protein